MTIRWFIIFFVIFSQASFAGQSMLKKNDLKYGREIEDGCADNLNEHALKIAKQAAEDFWIKGKTLDAVIQMDVAILIEPRLYGAYSILKLHYCWALKQCGRAVEMFKKAMTHCPEYPGHNFGLGSVYAKMGKPAKALVEYKKAQVKGYPDDPSFYYNMANAYRGVKKYEAALKNYQKSLELDEKHFEARKNMIILLFETGEKSAALDQARKFISLAPDEKTRNWGKQAIQHISR